MGIDERCCFKKSRYRNRQFVEKGINEIKKKYCTRDQLVYDQFVLVRLIVRLPV